MSFGQGSRSGLSFIKEVTFGTTPGTPAMVDLPINTHSIGLTKAAVESAEIRSDRQVNVFRHGNKQVGGNIECEFRALDYDDFLESAFFGTWTTAGVLKNGTTQHSFSIEDRQLDIGQYRLFSGVVVNTMGLSIKPNAMVMLSMGVVGKGMTVSGTSVDASTTAASGNAPFDSFSGTLNEGGSSIAIVTGLDINIENGVAPTFVIGSAVTPQLESGRSKVSGTLTAYFQDATLYNKFVNETESSLSCALTDGTHTYTIAIPRLKYSGGDLPLQNEQSRTITMPFMGLYNSGTTSTISITKS